MDEFGLRGPAGCRPFSGHGVRVEWAEDGVSGQVQGSAWNGAGEGPDPSAVFSEPCSLKGPDQVQRKWVLAPPLTHSVI